MINSDEYKNGYRKVYKMRSLGEKGLNIVVSVPPELVEREARKRNLTIEQFIEAFRAVAMYDGFDGIHYTFEPNKE